MTPIDPNVVVALVALLAAITTAAFVFLNARLTDLRQRLDNAEVLNHSLWAYTRRLINHIYKTTGEDPPPPDDSLAHLFPRSDT